MTTITPTDAALKGWWTWALSNGEPDHPDAPEMRKLLEEWTSGLGEELESQAFSKKPSELARDIEPYKVLKDEWRVCMLELIVAERKGMYERAREAYFRPFKVDDSTRSRRESTTMTQTTTTYVQLLIKRNATSEALRILDFMERRYTLDPHIYAFERAQVYDRMEEPDRAFDFLGMAFEGELDIKTRLSDGYGIFSPKQLFKYLDDHPEYENFLKAPRQWLDARNSDQL